MDPSFIQILDIGSKITTAGVLVWIINLLMKDRERVAAMFQALNAERAAMAEKQNEAMLAMATALATLTTTLNAMKDDFRDQRRQHERGHG